tara:strand:- start:4217 stop:6376 length:2160 start_codon:yes stop_codon:yes gene_type:complete
MGINQGNLVSDLPDLTVDVGDAGLIYVDSSNRVGIGVADPDSELEVLATSTQLKLSYDSDSFATFTVANDSHTTIATGQSGDLILDAADDVHLDAAGNTWKFLTAGTLRAYFENSSGDITLHNETQDKDLIFTGNDGGSGVTALKLDMSEAGSATFNSSVSMKEKANADADVAAYGQLWVKTATPNQLYFTTDAGDDIQITSGTGLAASGASALDDLSDVAFGSGDLVITSMDLFTTSDTAHNVAGTSVVIRAGNTTAGTTNNIAGGSLTIQGGQGKGSGAGGDIIFQVANEGGGGSSLNSFATALTISDDKTITMSTNDVLIDKHLTHNGDTDTRIVFFNAGDIIAFEAGGVEIARCSEGAQDEFVINDLSGDVDFRVEGNTDANLIFAEASTDRVSIGVSTDSPAALLEVTGDADTGVPLLQLNSLDVDKICLDINASQTTANVIDITADALTTGAVMTVTADALTDGSVFKIESDSSSNSVRSLIDITNDNTGATGTTLLQMKNDAIASNGSVIIESTAAETNPLVELINSNDSADKPPMLRFNKLGHASDDMDIGALSFYGENDAGTPEPVEYVKMVAGASDITDGSEGGEFFLSVMDDGTLTEALAIGMEDGSNTFALAINRGATDMDFIVYGDGVNNLIRTDGGNDTVSIGTNPSAHGAIFQVNTTTRFARPAPKMTTTERNALSNVVAGAMIYNTSTNKLQCHNGSGWQDCF